MLGTVGLEVTNSINSELSWKTVTKGKRSRKPVARCPSGRTKLGCKSPKRVGDFSGSDSDKFGENVIGQRFPDQIEYVPLKKRRHLLRSPSPPPCASLHSGESLSPQLHTPSSHSEDIEHLSDHYGSSGLQSSGSYSSRRGFVEAGIDNSLDDAVLVNEVSGVTCGELYDSDDFSGIALLADAACINNMDDETNNINGDVMEVSSMLRRYNASNSIVPFRESVSCSESEDLFQKDVSLLEHKKSPIVDNIVAAAHHSYENDKGVAVTSASSKVDRRHWDLNTVMETWEEHCAGSSFGSFSRAKASIDDGMQIDKLDGEGCTTRLDSGDVSENHVHLDLIDKTIESLKPKQVENKTVEFLCHERSCILETSDNNDPHSPEALCFSNGDAKCPRQVNIESESLDNFPTGESCHGSDTSTSAGNMNATSELPEDSSNVMGCAILETTEQYVTLPEIPVLEKSLCQNDAQNKDAGNCPKTFESPENRTSLKEEIFTDPSNVLNVEISRSSSEDHSHALSKCEGLSTSDISIGGHSAVSADAKGQDEKVSAADTRRTDSSVHPDSRVIVSEHDDHLVSDGEAEKVSILCDSGRGLICDTFHKSDVSQDDQDHLNDAEIVAELQVDYDSPYEDGELRGSILYSWEGNEIENGEDECVDYESDGRGGDDSVTGDYPDSEIIEAGSEGSQGTEKKSLPGTQAPETDFRVNDASKTTYEMPPDMVVGKNDLTVGRKHSSDRRDVFDVKGSVLGEVGSKASRGKLQSRIEGPSSLDISGRKEAVYTQQCRSRNIGSPFSRSEKKVCHDRFATRYGSSDYEHERNGGDSRSGHRDSRNPYPSSYHGPEDHAQSRPRSAIADSIDKFGGTNFHDHKQPLNYSSEGIRRPLVRGRSPIDTDDSYGVHRRMAGISSSRSKECSGNFAEWVGRGVRGEYNEPVLDVGTASSGCMPHYLSRRERNFPVDKFGGMNFNDHKQPVNHSSKSMQRPFFRRRSPTDRNDGYVVHRRIIRSRGSSGNFKERIGRGLRVEYSEPVLAYGTAPAGCTPHYLSERERSFSPLSSRVTRISVPYKKSRSRSGTRSPRGWQSQRELNLGTTRHRRSPECRSDSRMERMRDPFQKSSFPADYGGRYMSPARARFSPERNYRSVDEGNFVDSHLRHRRSPLGVFRRSERLDHVGLAGRLKSDDYFKPMARPGRYPLMAGVGRGCKLEENCDDRRHEDRSGMIHRGRQSGASAILRRYRHDAENFEAGNSNNDDGA